MATFVSENPGDSGTTAITSQGVTGPSSPATFAALLVGRTGGTATGALSGVTDTSSNTWVMATRGSVPGVSNTRVELWYCENYTPATTVTWTSGASQQSGWNILGFTGLLTASSLDVASPDNSATASTTTPATPSITSTTTGLLIAACQHGSSDGTPPGSPWTGLTSWTVNATAQGNDAYQISSAAGSYTATFTTTAAHQAGVLIAAFKDAPSVTVAKANPRNRARFRVALW